MGVHVFSNLKQTECQIKRFISNIKKYEQTLVCGSRTETDLEGAGPGGKT